MIHLSFPLVIIGGALVSDARARRSIWVAAVAGGTGLAALHAAVWGHPDSVGGLVGLPAGFLGVEGALFLAAAVSAIVGAFVTVRARQEAALELVGAGAAGAGGLWFCALALRCLAGSHPAIYLPALLVLAAAAALVVYAGRRWPGTARHDDAGPRGRRTSAAILLGGLLAAFAPGVGPVILGVILAAVAGYLAAARERRRLPITPLLAALLLPAWWLMATIAGPEGLPVRGLADRPWSPAAELMLAPVLLVSAWSLAGLWPLHRQVPSLLTAPVGALLVARVAIPVAPDGIAHWRTLALPLVLIGLWHATMTRRWAGAAAALAWIGLLAANRTGEIGAALLFIAALLLAVCERLETRARLPALAARLAGAMAGGAGALLATAAGLHVEVVYTVLAVPVASFAAARGAPAQASTASAPSTTAASV